MLCAGTLYDTGGPNNDYTNNEDFSFVICPNTPAACITFTLEYYHLEPSLPDAVPQGQGDQLYFYDGPSVNSPLLAALDGAPGSPENIAGGGGVGRHQAIGLGGFKFIGPVRRSISGGHPDG